MYDYLIVGAGFFGAVFARQMTDAGKKVLVIDKRDHIGGNAYTRDEDGIHIHQYGAHIFHTDNERVWAYVNGLVPFLPFINSPIANYKGELYPLPFNMHTFHALWGVNTPAEAMEKVESQRLHCEEPQNLEEQALTLVGPDIYEKLIKGYTQKQWGRPCNELPAYIIRRLPLRFSYNNNYFNSRYQGIPEGGYTRLFEALLQGIEVRLGCNYLDDREGYRALAEKVIYTGPVDEYFGFVYGPLQYRSVAFKTEMLPVENFQGNAVFNYTDAETPYTRVIEHKWFQMGKGDHGETLPTTAVSYEYSHEWKVGEEPYYPVNNAENNALFAKYKALADAEEGVLFGGRLGDYAYYDMDKVTEKALQAADAELAK